MTAETIRYISGPWTATKQPYAGWWAIQVERADERQETIAEVRYQYDSLTTEATALLIAAAPQMLAALRTSLIGLRRDARNTADFVRAAIAAATGEQP